VNSSDQTVPGPFYSTDPADFSYMAVNVPCQAACPAFTDVPAYIRAVYEGGYGKAYELNRMVNVLPGVLGRVCSRPCETKCRHGEAELGKPVNICHIKRAASDFKEARHIYTERLFARVGKKVCIVGSGPAGLAAAHDLATVGFDVTILEAFDQPGGMLRYGIPEFRLPRDVLAAEIDSILRLGMTLKTDVRVGRDVSIDELLASHEAVLLASGCYVSRAMDIPGERLPGVHSGLPFVVDVSSGRPPTVGTRVLVLGAGFTAFDCARLALRYGAEEVSICIRGTESELRVTEDEILEAKREGVKIQSLMVAQRILGEHAVERVEFLRTAPGERLPNGKRRMDPIPGSEVIVPADSVIVAVGQGAEAIAAPGEKDARGVVTGDPTTFRTTAPGLYVAGDFQTGPTTVIEAISAGRRAAARMAEDLAGKTFRQWAVRMQDAGLRDRQRAWDFIPRVDMPTVSPMERRFDAPEIEVEQGFSRDQAHEECKRCYLCYLHYEIDVSRCIYCRYCIDVAPRDCIKLVSEILLDEQGAVAGYQETGIWDEVNAVVIDNSRCIRCGECMKVCPVDCISVAKVELVERYLEGEGE
jgi:NADPH-dependent glutamate synthase beta subunit-like oxidoreductase/ferredoxin